MGIGIGDAFLDWGLLLINSVTSNDDDDDDDAPM